MEGISGTTHVLKEVCLNVPVRSFWDAYNLWKTNSHFINRRLIGSSLVFSGKITIKNNNLKQFIDEIISHRNAINKNTSPVDFIRNIACVLDVDHISLNDFISSDFVGIYVNIILLLPKNENWFEQYQIDIIEKQNQKITIVPPYDTNITLVPSFIYGFQYVDGKLSLWVSNIKNDQSKSIEWLKEKVFPKICKWSEEAEQFEIPTIKSLSLVPIKEYWSRYQELKKKYAAKIIEIWPENTDPLKFVYEDVAIATYLILLWKNEAEQKALIEKQSFVDLGCGNGLLVYILNQEGYPGKGIDVRSRKIWKLYPASTNLEVTTIIPSNKYIFPNTDWIIGNHSDELTPWIPVIAARSSNKCRYFVLPCCAYEFDGTKYQRKNSSVSQYTEYLDYVQNISEICNFITYKDKLRIPSTKRICLVGFDRRDNKDTESQIQQFIDSKCDTKSDNGEWIKQFMARPSVEVVRNCTKIDKKLTQSIVKRVTSKLLETNNFSMSEYNEKWNCGGILKMKQVISLIKPEELKQLKNECGGIQTLLKNHHYIFKVVQGTIQFRVPSIAYSNSKFARKTQCWFQENHPNGCPVKNENCIYKHT